MKIGMEVQVSRERYQMIESFLGARVIYTEDPHDNTNDAILISPTYYGEFTSKNPEHLLTYQDIHPSKKILVWCK